MHRTYHLSLLESSTDIRIVDLNRDKTRKTNGSYTTYQMYFELSAAPPMIWRDIFGREWNNINSAQEAGIDGRFLVMQCPLQEIAAIHLPELKKAVAATNEAYKRYVQEEATVEERPDDEWMPASWVPQTSAIDREAQERKTVDDLAKLLVFE